MNTIYEFDNYRSFLRAKLAERMEKNSGYSLRAMAKHIGVASSTLSEVINGRANLSLSAATKIAGALKLKSTELKYFLGLVQIDSSKDPLVREQLIENLSTIHPKKRKVDDLTLEQFRQIADWYHSAILELAYVKGFRFTPANAAKVLGIPKPTAELAIERLLKLELLEQDMNGNLQRVHPELRVQSDIKHAGMRQYYVQMLEKIAQALQEQSPKERLSGYLNLPINPAALPEIDEAIDRFFSNVKTIASKYPEASKVYHLSLHFINLMKESL